MLEKNILLDLEKYIETYIQKESIIVCESCDSCDNYNEMSIVKASPARARSKKRSIDDFVNTRLQPTFSEVLFLFIDKKHLKDSDVYKRALLDRRLFSKIRSKENYQPSKNTAIALALSLELSAEETNRLLSSAGYSLSDSYIFDLVIRFCIEKKVYNLMDVNEALDYFSLKPLV